MVEICIRGAIGSYLYGFAELFEGMITNRHDGLRHRHSEIRYFFGVEVGPVKQGFNNGKLLQCSIRPSRLGNSMCSDQ